MSFTVYDTVREVSERLDLDILEHEGDAPDRAASGELAVVIVRSTAGGLTRQAGAS